MNKGQAKNMQSLRRFIASHPEGVTHKQIRAAGVSMQWLDYLKKHKLIVCEQIKEYDNEAKEYHWLYKARPMEDL